MSVALEKAKVVGAPPPPGAPYSVAIEGSEQPGRSKVYRHWRFKDEMLVTLDTEITTAHEFFEQTGRSRIVADLQGFFVDLVQQTDYPHETALDIAPTIPQRRPLVPTYGRQLHRQAGVTEGKYGIGLWCQNRPEWQISDLACMSQSLFSVSMYDTLGPDTTEYIINHASLACVISSLNHVPTLLKLKPRCPTLKLIVCLDPLSAGELPGESKAELLNALAADQGVKIHYIRDVEAIGEASPRPYNPPRPDDIITINYTSGTTGNPKGVCLTHANAVAAASSSLTTVRQSSNDVICSYLPLAHIFQRVTEHSALWAGAQIGYFHGNIAELVDDLKLLRPTAFTSVPRLYNRFGGAIKAATVQAPGVKGALSRHIVNAKTAALNNPVPGKATNKHALYDRIWSRKVVSAFGLDRTRTMVSGSAPLDPSLHQFLRVVFANHFLQGYGLTETYAVSLAQLEGDFSSGNCVAVAPSTEACLLDVPDMDYMSTDQPHPRFREYFRNPAETEKAILPDGWFRTGDICSIDDMGRVRVIDRVKNVLKLAQGEYISPERIENVYLGHLPWLAQAYVHGDSSKSHLVAILGIQPDAFAAWVSKVVGKEIKAEDVKALEAAAQEERVRRAVVKELDKVGKRNKFNSYERVRGVRLLVEPFTIENELLTPT
ncbi:hypothetical protein B0A49_05215 [Cryomyces minteri]|uniref:AMP-dependent synthetase/ligase domain-containing protein n=2 Tax=Cryomyces TaxID=329878 RepID=A0A4U0X1W2_9PEZI|nr:hypothetical protein B0A49_05215 [Cryomyces minteri]